MLGGLLLMSCRLGVRRTERDPVVGQLAHCEALLGGAPVSRETLDTYIQCLLVVHNSYADDGRVHARISRGLHARAGAFPDAARDDLHTARTWGLQCLALRASVAGRLAVSGGRVDERTLAVVPSQDAPCLTWAALSWSRWLQERGVAGAAIDLESVVALARRAVDIAPQQPRGLSYEALGVALGVVPSPLDRDADAAGEALTEARQQAPDRLSSAVAMAELIYGPAGDRVAWQRTLQAVVGARGAQEGIEAVEDAAARSRAQALLDRGMPAPSRW